jgi:hypothetical protein
MEPSSSIALELVGVLSLSFFLMEAPLLLSFFDFPGDPFLLHAVQVLFLLVLQLVHQLLPHSP